MPTTSLTPAFRLVTSHTGATKLLVSLGLLFALLVSALPVAAQEAEEATPDPDATPDVEATPEPEDEPAEVSNIMEVEFEEFPAAPVTVRLLRITLEPGASVPLHTHPGPELNYIETGTLTATADGDALVALGDGTDTTVSDGESIDLEPEDAIVYPQGVGMAFGNEGEEPVDILSTVVLPVEEDLETIVYTDGVPTEEDFEGVSFTVLGDGLMQELPEGVTTVSIDTVSVAEGAALPGTEGPTLYSLVDGDFGFTVEEGLVQVSRTADPSLQPNALPGDEYELEPGDAAIFPAGVSGAERGESEALDLFRVLITPAEELADSPASIVMETAIATVDDGTSGAPTDIDEDPETAETAVTLEDNLNLRSEPSVDAEIVTEMAAGVELAITGDQVEADDFVWLPVQVIADETTAGWVVTDFLELLDTEPDAAEPEDEVVEEEPEATPDIDPADLAEGDTVAVSEELVRMRFEGTLTSDIVDAFPQGTQFILTGEPVEDETGEYVWAPVALIDDDSVTGFIPVDFLAPATPAEDGEDNDGED